MEAAAVDVVEFGPGPLDVDADRDAGPARAVGPPRHPHPPHPHHILPHSGSCDYDFTRIHIQRSSSLHLRPT